MRSVTIEEFRERVKHIHDTRYEYDLRNFKNGTSVIRIKCNLHGWFEQKAGIHLAGSGCSKCGKLNTIAGIKASTSQHRLKTKRNTASFVRDSISVHGVKYDYSQTVYISYRKPVSICCPEHGVFEILPAKHLSAKRGCHRCAIKNNGTSKLADEWLDAEKITNRETLIAGYRVDGFDEETNTVYQFHGDFWHGNPKLYAHDELNPVTGKPFGEAYERTLRIEEDIRSKGFNLVVMWEHEYRTLKKLKHKRPTRDV